MKFTKILILSLCSTVLCSGAVHASLLKKKSKSKTEQQVEKKTPTPYEKLFKDKKSHTEKGLITLHKIDGKVYFEFPLNLLGREMLLGSSVESTCDNGESVVGQKPHSPIPVIFSQLDSAIQIRYLYNNSVSSNKSIEEAIAKNNIPSILKSFPVKAYSPDSTAVVFDATDFFVADIDYLDPFDPYGTNTYYGWMARTSKFKQDLSFIGDIAAYEDNFSISSHMTYTVSYAAMGMFIIQTDKPFTAVVRRSFMLLPENVMRPRLADPRIGIFYRGKMRFEEQDNGMRPEYYANRWRLEPKDMEAYKRGELVDPVTPIVFYIDNDFPEMWKKYIKAGIEEWNPAFEKIGFRNAIQALPYPKDNPEFSTNNLKYSCVSYAPSPNENAMGPSWTDPRSGEILNASVVVYHNLVHLLYTWRFIQTAAVDPSVRFKDLPEEVMGDAIRYVTSHEVGHCFGFMHNMSASSAYPVDSLRSPSFTQKYGTTPSIMDYARFNYIAQPGDLERGVRLTPPALGPYDLYAVKWLYQPLPEAKTAKQEVDTLSKWITEKAGDPVYRYGKQQIMSAYDPSSQTEDLGDDAVKATRYGMNNLKYIMAHFNEWLEKDDLNGNIRNEIYYSLLQQLRTYLGHVTANIGGIYLTERYVGDPLPTYDAVPKAKQKEALNYLLELQEDLSWLDNDELSKQLPIIGTLSSFMQRTIMRTLVRRAPEMSFCALKSNDPYTEQEYINDLIDYVMKPVSAARVLTDADRTNQLALLEAVIAETDLTPKMGSTIGIADNPMLWLDSKLVEINGYMPQGEGVNAFGYQRRVQYKSAPDQSNLYYGALMRMRDTIKKAIGRSDVNSANHYKFMLAKIDYILKVK